MLIKKIEMIRIKIKFEQKLSDQIDKTSNIQKYSTADQDIQRKKKEKKGRKKQRKKEEEEIKIYIYTKSRNQTDKEINK